MKKYKIQIKLLYEYIDNSGFKREIKYEYNTYCLDENNYHCIIEIKPNFNIEIRELICEDQNEAVLAGSNILEYICKILTVLLQTQNYDVRPFQPNITFRKSDINIKEEYIEEPIKVMKKENENDNISFVMRDRIGMRDKISSMKITQGLNLENTKLFYDAYLQGDVQEFYIDTIFRTLRTRDIESKYFTLFTMIERIETTYKKEGNISTNLFLKDQRKVFLDKLKPQIDDIVNKNDGLAERVFSRLAQIVCDATVETRAEKLCKVLRQYYHIDKISKGIIHFEISCEKIQEFIDARNTLFHGKGIKKDDLNKIAQLCNELLELCIEILKAEL